ncbi:uncharacterized protein [Clytia hemisphaerica]|uniref:uncharacterized protein n=1 Tax=Clytia hemisphaerica TaxID=252671 RepID=UPI0034D6C02D
MGASFLSAWLNCFVIVNMNMFEDLHHITERQSEIQGWELESSQYVSIHPFAIENCGDDKNTETVVTIPRAKKTAGGARVYDKLHACYYCGKSDELNFWRHMTTRHKDEELVKEIMCLPASDKAKQIDLLRFKGDNNHNVKVLKVGGELIVLRRLQESDIVSIKDYIPCQFCLAFITKQEMWRHHKTCKFTNGRTGSVRISKILLFSSQSVASTCSDELRLMVLDKMKHDDIHQIVRKDEIILKYGSFKLENSGLRRQHTISERMRLIGRLVRELRDSLGKDDLKLQDALKPQHFDDIVMATKKLGGFSVTTQEGEPVSSFSVPPTPLKIGYTVIKCAELLRGMAIRNGNSACEEAVKRFIKLYEMEWSQKISTVSLRTLGTNKFVKSNALPITEDLLKLRTFLQTGIRACTMKLDEEVSLQNWRNLAEMVGTRLTMFNRRRASEVFQLMISRYNNREEYTKEHLKDIEETLSPLERNLMKSMNLVHVSGKRGRQVPILFNQEEKTALDLLIKVRASVGISPDNIYILAAPTRNSKNHLRDNDFLRKIVAEIPNLVEPNRIKSTDLRKYCGTVSQIIDFNENGMRWLADHMGHNLDFHREFYRLRESTVELAKVSKLLMAMDEGVGNHTRR